MRSARYLLALLLALVGFAAASPVASASPLGNWISWGNDPRPGVVPCYSGSKASAEQDMTEWGGGAIRQSAESVLNTWYVVAYGSTDTTCLSTGQYMTRVILMATHPHSLILRGDGCVYRAKMTYSGWGNGPIWTPTLPFVVEWCGQQN